MPPKKTTSSKKTQKLSLGEFHKTVEPTAEPTSAHSTTSSKSWADDGGDEFDYENDFPTASESASNWRKEAAPEKPAAREETEYASSAPSAYEQQPREYREPRGERAPREPREPRPYDNEPKVVPEVPPFVLFLGNLPFEVTQDDIREFFSGLDIIHVVLPIDREKNKPKGHGYIEMSNKEDLERAITANGADFLGRRLRVDLTAPEIAQRYSKASRPQSSRGGFASGFKSRPPREELPKSVADEVDDWRRKAKEAEPSAFAQMFKSGRRGRTEEGAEEGGAFRGGRGRGRGRGDFGSFGGSQASERKPLNLKPRSVDAPVGGRTGNSELFGEGKAWEETEEIRKKTEQLAIAPKAGEEGERADKQEGRFSAFSRRGKTERGGRGGSRGGARSETRAEEKPAKSEDKDANVFDVLGEEEN